MGEKKPLYNVVVKSFTDKSYREVVTKEPVSERKAERIERGVLLQLNTRDYFVTMERVVDGD
jgi:hypothetical protein